MHRIRFAQAADTPVILGFIRALAVYEKLEADCVATEESLRASLFGPRPYAEVLLIEEGGKAHGFALFFHNYSTFLARPGIYLEDLFVDPAARGKGYGKALLAKLAEIAVERGCGRLEWSVLDWNRPAIDFYLSLGARPMDEWTVYRVDGAALGALAAQAG
ncbi:MAG: N-acetyltransferase [Hyphomonas sp.]|uniref:GNAT family N-acetyltransferase n=1 Tax=Hyphomonas sp. TaxID=87 RepID=UPI001DA0390B|nr:GNAT family N-acetyltransferase [Hyphomonas sp.]MBA4228443.1 N-acetyltransferase [Hyphomonas sp.]